MAFVITGDLMILGKYTFDQAGVAYVFLGNSRGLGQQSLAQKMKMTCLVA